MTYWVITQTFLRWKVVIENNPEVKSLKSQVPDYPADFTTIFSTVQVSLPMLTLIV